MKTALITTTIHVPRVLKLYCANSLDVQFFVAADEKTPREAYEFCAGIPHCEIYSPDRQRELGYACSELIGWNTIGRRNIMTLEALKWGADVIVTIDDDNIPIRNGYFHDFQIKFGKPPWPATAHRPLAASSQQGWYDPGDLLVPKTKHRGFPIQVKPEPSYEAVTDARIGVAQGLCLGDPDIDAVTRIALAPSIHSVSELGRAGIVTDPKQTWSVFNSQNTAIVRELAPAFFMTPGTGRFDDIYASLICQRVMREQNLHVHYGQPFVWQQRNRHDLIEDLRVEIEGMANVKKLGELLNNGAFSPGTTVLQAVDCIYRLLQGEDWWPSIASEAGLAWREDCEKVL